MTVLTMVDAIRATLADEMERDERVVLFGQDVGFNGGVFRATDGLQARFGSHRVVDTPLSEACILGAAVGLAMAGMVPVPEIQFLPFTQQGFHQIAGQISRLRNRTYGRYGAPITIRAPFGGGVRTPELHSDSMEAIYAHVPGLKIVAPATAADAKGLLASSIRDEDPVLFLEPLRGYRLTKDDVPDHEHLVPLGKARLVAEGTDLVIIAWSGMVDVARRAADEVRARMGASIAVLDLRSIVPLDTEAIAHHVAQCGRAVVLQESVPRCGFASEVITVAMEHAFWSLQAPIARVSAWDVPYPPGLLEDHYIPSVDRVVSAIVRTLGEAS